MSLFFCCVLWFGLSDFIIPQGQFVAQPAIKKKKEETKQTHKHQQDTWKSVKSEEQSFRTLQPDGNILNSAFSDSGVPKEKSRHWPQFFLFTKWSQKKKSFK